MSTTISLSSIAETVGGTIIGSGTAEVNAITIDSRAISAGSLFVAVRGTRIDGHTFLEDVFSKGAVAAVVEDADALNGKTGIVVENSRKAWSAISALWFDNPTKELAVVGITGTNGKTTVLWLLSQALKKFNRSTVRMGTMGVFLDDTFIEDTLTSPDAYDVHRRLQIGLRDGATAAVMEVSSHALHQYRVDDVNFDIAIFTNLSRDHLDYHPDMESYFEAKQRLFTLTARSGGKGAVINLDDSDTAGALMSLCEAEGLPVLTYGFDARADVRIVACELDPKGATVRIETNGEQFEFYTPCIGEHNALNLAAVWGALRLFSISDKEIESVMGSLEPACGRLEWVGTDSLDVYVDYAHTPDALENVLKALRPVTKKRLWVVFGCGGDRDPGKRPITGKVAADFADVLVVTSDNPRTEDPDAIIEDILASGITPEIVTPDRKQAILMALEQAEPGDVVLIANKGHETYQILGTKKVPFSDQKIVKDFFAAR